MNKLIVFYDNFCPNCTKFNKLVKKLDWFNLIDSKQLRNELLISSSFRNIDFELAKQEMASNKNEVWFYGFNTIYLILKRLPLFWFFIPLLYFLKITNIGQFLYKQLAINRKIIPIHCDKNSCIS